MKYVKLSPVEILMIVAISTFVIAIIAKVVLWFLVKQKRRPKFWKSFLTFYSQQDIYNRSSVESKRFRYGSNVVNFICLISLLLMIVAYVLSGDTAKDTPPSRKQNTR